jgi:membrane-associated phospholipid phosphatase
VAASYLAAFAVFSYDRRHSPWLLVWATAIFASTLTTKQHYLVDGLAGLALAAMVWVALLAHADCRCASRRRSSPIVCPVQRRKA